LAACDTQERSGRKTALRRVQALEEELEQCRSELSAAKGQVAMSEHDSQLRERLQDDLSTSQDQEKALRAQLTAANEEKAEAGHQLAVVRQESEAMQRHAQYQLLQSGNEARLKEHLQVGEAGVADGVPCSVLLPPSLPAPNHTHRHTDTRWFSSPLTGAGYVRAGLGGAGALGRGLSGLPGPGHCRGGAAAREDEALEGALRLAVGPCDWVAVPRGLGRRA
jgi:hypothetical protein